MSDTFGIRSTGEVEIITLGIWWPEEVLNRFHKFLGANHISFRKIGLFKLLKSFRKFIDIIGIKSTISSEGLRYCIWEAIKSIVLFRLFLGESCYILDTLFMLNFIRTYESQFVSSRWPFWDVFEISREEIFER